MAPMLLLVAAANAYEPVEAAVGVHVSEQGFDRLGGAIADVMPAAFPVAALGGELVCDDADPSQVLTYTLNGDYREFKAVVGIPEYVSDANLEAKLTIEADGRAHFSETLKRKDKPKGVSLDVKGVKSLRIVVEADFAVNGNRVLLGAAVVQK